MRPIIPIIVAAGILTASSAAHAPSLDFTDCHDDLDRLRRMAADASDAAEDAQSRKEEFEDCRGDPERHIGCRTAGSDYESAIGDLASKLDDLDSRLRSVQASCGYEFTINRMSAPEASQRHMEAARRRVCTSMKKLVSMGVPPNSVLQMCKANSDEEWCKACLGLK